MGSDSCIVLDGRVKRYDTIHHIATMQANKLSQVKHITGYKIYSGRINGTGKYSQLYNLTQSSTVSDK